MDGKVFLARLLRRSEVTRDRTLLAQVHGVNNKFFSDRDEAVIETPILTIIKEKDPFMG